MKKLPLLIVASSFVGALAGCHDRGSRSRDALEPPDDSGVVSADLAGRWRITQVDPQRWITDGVCGNEAIAPATGLMPPAVGATITIAGGELTDGNGMPLQRPAPGGLHVVTSYFNHVDDRTAIYTLRYHTDSSRAVAGDARSLQMALGTTDRDHLLGVIYHRWDQPRRQSGDPVEVLVLVRLERVP